MDVMFRDISAAAFERLARRQVEREFANLPPDARELPFIGGWPFLDCERAEQKRYAVAALCCARWAENELPPWMLPLLLRAKDCQALFNRPCGDDYRANCRARLRGDYGMHALTMHWVIERLTPFEIFCAH